MLIDRWVLLWPPGDLPSVRRRYLAKHEPWVLAQGSLEACAAAARLLVMGGVRYFP